jgi:hypothetical protein
MTMLASVLLASSRWDFGLDNPNKAAAILAFLVLVLLSAAMRARRAWARWCCAALSLVAGYGLVRTFSRGGLVALAVGAIVLCAGSCKHPCRRLLPALLLALALAGAAICTGFAERIAKSMPSADASVGNRLAVWKAVPAMVVDAPGGWGLGNAGDEYMGWYQPLDRHERYRTLVNSHFTWLVEFGWAGRLAYTCGLLIFLGMGITRLRARGDPLPLAVYAGFVASAFFSSVAEEWLVCAIPLAMLLPMLKTFVFEATPRMRRVTLAAALLAGVLLLAGVAALGTVFRPEGSMPMRRSYDGARLIAGDGEPVAWVVVDPEAMGGPAFGRILRGFMEKSGGGAYGMAQSLAAVPDDVRHLALCGRAADIGAEGLARFSALDDVRLISPRHPKKWLAARAKTPCIRVFCGEFSRFFPEGDAEGLTVVGGAAEFIPDWPRLALSVDVGSGTTGQTVVR